MAIIWALGEEAFRHTDLVIPQPSLKWKEGLAISPVPSHSDSISAIDFLWQYMVCVEMK